LSIPHVIADGFKNINAVGLEINYQFKEMLATGEPAAPTKAAAPSAEPIAKETKKEEKAPEPEEEDMDMGGLFG